MVVFIDIFPWQMCRYCETFSLTLNNLSICKSFGVIIQRLHKSDSYVNKQSCFKILYLHNKPNHPGLQLFTMLMKKLFIKKKIPFQQSTQQL